MQAIHDEILTVEISNSAENVQGANLQDDQAAHATGSMKENPLPVLKINGNVRFRKSDVDSRLAREECRVKGIFHQL